MRLCCRFGCGIMPQKQNAPGRKVPAGVERRSEMRKVNDFLLAILAGAAISFGGTVFLSLESKVLGSLFFAIGLFMVCTLKLNLFTGKACYLPGKKPVYVAFLCLVWVGNLVGAQLVATLLKLTRVGPVLVEKAIGICQIKTDDTLISLFILGVFCNIMIYVGVESHMANEHQVGKYLGIIFGVMVFILCSYEHCVADMFYFAMAGWTPRAFACTLAITLGNVAGGVIFPLCALFKQKTLGD